MNAKQFETLIEYLDSRIDERIEIAFEQYFVSKKTKEKRSAYQEGTEAARNLLFGSIHIDNPHLAKSESWGDWQAAFYHEIKRQDEENARKEGEE